MFSTEREEVRASTRAWFDNTIMVTLVWENYYFEGQCT